MSSIAGLNRAPLFLWITLIGLASAASTAWPGNFLSPYGAPVWWLQLFSVAIFYRLLAHPPRGVTRFRLALAYATVLLAASFSWLYTAMHTYGGLSAWVAIVALVALAAALGLYYALAAYFYDQLSGISPAFLPAAFAALWTAAELARGTWLTGFGWGAPGYAHTLGPLAGYAPLVGVYGVGALALWIAATWAFPAQVPRWQLLVSLSLVLVGPNVRSIEWTQPNGGVTVALLQGNIAQSEKFEESTGVAEALNWYANAIADSTAQLTIAPETAIPLFPLELPAGYWETLKQQVASKNKALITGIPLGDYPHGYTNSVLAVQGSTEYRYDKHHLVPFGEFIPPLFRWFTSLMNIPLGDFQSGALGQPSFAFADQRLAPNICYEDLFGEELGTRFLVSAAAPTIFVNVSNLGWFGDGLVIDQHLEISRMRALEFERPFVRATNTGATAIMDHRGTVIASLPRMTQGVLNGVVQGRTGLTPFAWWISRFGLWPYWAVIGTLMMAAWRAKLARR